MDNEAKQFDETYVKSLREEAAGYRTQVRDLKSQLEDYRSLEGQIHTLKIENELYRRGIEADPSFIQLKPNQAVSEAVDNFLAKYPQFVPQIVQPTEPTPQPAEIPNTIPPQAGNANTPGARPVMFGDRSIMDMAQDPVARQQITAMYQNKLHKNPAE